MSNKLKPFMIGDLEVKVPIIQGGMGIKVSTASLVAAVANCGGVGTIASVALGFGTPENENNFVKASHEGLEREIREAKKLTDGIVGINILVALSNYEELARISVKEKADFIVSGAGLPLRLPEFTEGSSIKLIPIVSSTRALDLIVRAWKKRYNRLPDAIVVEGPMAGGHLGFTSEGLELKSNNLENLVLDVIKYIKDSNLNIPVISAGGIYDGKDVARFLKLGVSGVQIATRFVATYECSVSEKFKQLYVNSKDSDIVIIKSPVGMPGRAIKTKLIERVMNGERIPVRCSYRCLKSCNPKTAPYCICKALGNAVLGNLDEAVVFCGSNASRINKIVSVKELMDEIVSETEEALNS